MTYFITKQTPNHTSTLYTFKRLADAQHILRTIYGNYRAESPYGAKPRYYGRDRRMEALDGGDRITYRIEKTA